MKGLSSLLQISCLLINQLLSIAQAQPDDGTVPAFASERSSPPVSSLASVANIDPAMWKKPDPRSLETPPTNPAQTPGLSSATEMSAPSNSAPISTASRVPRVHLVKAGAGGFVFEPAQLTDVVVGDIVTFEFYPPDHSVARAEFGSACVPYEYTGKSKVGFWSQTQWVSSTSEVS